MSKKFIIVESPTKAKTITKFLNDDYVIRASMGHIRDLPAKELGVDLNDNFKPIYITDKSKNKIIKELKDNAASADSIYLASDHDREGEAIAWHLSHLLKKELKGKIVGRIIFNEITEKSIKNALKEPGSIDMNKVDAQQARRILDRIVGYKVSPVLWKVIAKNLSAGRVQSVALRLICERESEISKFITKEFWTIEAILKKDELSQFKAILTGWKGDKPDLNTKENADEILDYLKNKKFLLKDIEKKSRSIQPYPPYITSTLQQDASKILGFSTKKTMMVAQQLYEGIDINGSMTGMISYMRTDSTRISDEANESVRRLIKDRFGKDDLNTSVRKFSNKKSAQDAHEAIRPTDSFRTPESVSRNLSSDQLKLYTLIWQRFVATQMLPVSLNQVNLLIDAGVANFKASGSVIKQEGFKKVNPHITVTLGEGMDPRYEIGNDLECSEI
ncbi:MAG: type I DNA topoisomerase, partial [Candidatus Cloacimonetes bacterium]|nr:type I DNA topoisomerase [Candidatus Cloacimonadota bacterium]